MRTEVTLLAVWLTCLAASLPASLAESRAGAPPAAPRSRAPLIFSTDLFHPHDDPDDHFDVATVFALPEYELRAILLDLGDRQQQRPGRIPLEQLFALTGRRAPFAAGLNEPLQAPGDHARERPAPEQAAIALLLRTLRDAPEPVVLVATGSLRDICVAFNREPDLLRSKVSRLYINIGHIDGGYEWNVRLDPHAYVGIMRSGLPIYWCPCMPMEGHRSTYWKFRHAEVLEGAPLPVLNFFIYALQRVTPGEVDPRIVIDGDLRPWRHLVLGMERNMWSTASILHGAGRKLYRTGTDRWIASAAAPDGSTPADVFTFAPVRLTIDDKGVTSWKDDADAPNMHVYRVTDAENHEKALTSCLRDLLARFPLARPGGTRPR